MPRQRNHSLQAKRSKEYWHGRPLFFGFGIILALFLQGQAYTKSRMIIMADMDNEPDEMQQNVHMLMYSNMFELEGLIACTGIYLKTRVAPELYTQLVSAYAKVYENLKKHATGWPDPVYLQSLVKGGIPGYGKAAVGSGKSSPGSNLIVQALLKEDPRKIYFVGNAGTNNLLQALWDLDAKHYGTKSPMEMDALTSKIIVFENGSQDNCGAWIAGEYPKVAWNRSNGQTYAWGGGGQVTSTGGPVTWEPYPDNTQGQSDWAIEHIMTNHGALGALYPKRHNGDWFLEGGGTTPWMGLANHGLTDPEKLEWGGWSGRFSKVKELKIFSNKTEIKPDEMTYPSFSMYNSDSQSESWTDPVTQKAYNGYLVPVYRFRRAMWNDERARMDWCVKDYKDANHNPIASINGDTSDTILMYSMKPGASLLLNASGTKDPDGDAFDLNWWVYKEAGSYPGTVSLANTTGSTLQFQAPADADGKEIHLILEVVDKNNPHSIVGMHDYRRIVISVSSTSSLNQPKVDLRQEKLRNGARATKVFYTGNHFVLTTNLGRQGSPSSSELRLAIYDLAGHFIQTASAMNSRIIPDFKKKLNSGAYLAFELKSKGD